uniref:Extensin n=1 Tax=Phallusia mammillata TaxID=59560 RepID=A0A6F9D8J8_9ASCI|nr:extensin [Phallusia mammillata]
MVVRPMTPRPTLMTSREFVDNSAAFRLRQRESVEGAVDEPFYAPVHITYMYWRVVKILRRFWRCLRPGIDPLYFVYVTPPNVTIVFYILVARPGLSRQRSIQPSALLYVMVWGLAFAAPTKCTLAAMTACMSLYTYIYALYVITYLYTKFQL